MDKLECGCIQSPYYSMCDRHFQEHSRLMTLSGYRRCPEGFVYDPVGAQTDRIELVLCRVEKLLERLENG